MGIDIRQSVVSMYVLYVAGSAPESIQIEQAHETSQNYMGHGEVGEGWVEGLKQSSHLRKKHFRCFAEYWASFSPSAPIGNA